jgi:WD40 repeat protein
MLNRVGQQLGNYRLVRLLGRGSFAEVYLGEHLYLKTEAAVKVLHGHLAETNVQDFLTEAQIIARLVHPHIVRILDFDVENETAFFVMDYAPNGTLRQCHPRGTPLPLSTIVHYTNQVADALQYAHDQRLIHRDIKPENILLGRQNKVLLSDFGIVQVIQSTLLVPQEIVGTVAYMSPEQLQGRAHYASDQYALGIMVYEWLSGDRPFQGSITEMVWQHVFVPPPSLKERVPAISPAIEHVVLTVLQKDPHQRFASVQAFATALEHAYRTTQTVPVACTSKISPPSQSWLPIGTVPGILPSLSSQSTDGLTSSSAPAVSPSSTKESVSSNGLQPSTSGTTSGQAPIRSSRPTSPNRLQLTKLGFSRRQVLVGLAGLAGLTVVGGGTTLLVLAQKPLIGTTLYTYRGHSGYVSAVVWSPDGKRIASGSVDTTVQVWDAANGSHVFIYRGHSYYLNAVAWSPDGRRIASGDGKPDTTVQVWDAADGSHVFTYRGHSSEVYTLAWSPDGRRVASGSVDTTVQVWDAADGSHVFTYRGHSGYVSAVAWSPDGKRIASVSNDYTVQVWDTADGSQVFIYRGHSARVNGVAWSPDGKRIASVSDDYTVQVWDAANGSHVFTYRGHSDVAYVVAWSPDGRRIASGSFDTTVQVWDAADGSQVFTYRGHSGEVRALAWSPDGRQIASSGYIDNIVQVWEAE